MNNETNNGNVMQTFVEYKSIMLHRVGNNFYLCENGNTYPLSETKVKDVLKQLDDNECNNPLTAALYLIKEKESITSN